LVLPWFLAALLSAVIALHLVKHKSLTNLMLDPLAPFLPDNAVPVIAEMLKNENYHLVVTKPRTTKFGDFKPPVGKRTPRLTVNGNLNQYAFLITLVHEIAHLKVWNTHKNKVKPHGIEWKTCYASLLQQCVDEKLFDSALEPVVKQHIKKPGYASGTDRNLTLALKKYDEGTQAPTLEDLPMGAPFRIGKKVFIKGKLMRKRYLCEEQATKRQYRVHALAEVEQLTSVKLG
jgi:SprT protein